MKSGRTELVFIIDRNGSMSGLEDDTIGGFNSMLKEQQGVDSGATVTADSIGTQSAYDTISAMSTAFRTDGSAKGKHFGTGCPKAFDVNEIARQVLAEQDSEEGN